ncbi:hypothetical protein ACPWT1_05825 [Ramlibacter sp. MMS24-I3-19]|uniref:hypothetical protein n=1 Tax=Ramlibacter sp. MMS24-I3-19 TaxID=3416606 RepID=UPI003D081779
MVDVQHQQRLGSRRSREHAGCALGATGGAIPKTYGGNTYFDSVFQIANALSSRSVVVITASGTRAIFRLSDKSTQSRLIDETAGSAPAFRRVYMRALN